MKRTWRGHRHGEAYMLMTYECTTCGHLELFWNARDGVTPFGCPCPACAHGDMLHINWEQDCYAPEYMPLPGQGVWIDMPRELVRPVVRMALRVYEEEHGEAPEDLVEALKGNYGPETPWLLRWPDYGGQQGGQDVMDQNGQS